MSKKVEKIKIELGINPDDVFANIERIVNTCNTTYSDAIIHYCQQSNNEIETIADLVKSNPKLKHALQLEYEALNMLPKTSRLPI
jgi:hypothetical protein